MHVEPTPTPLTDWLRSALDTTHPTDVDTATLEDLREGLDALAVRAAARVDPVARPLRLTKATVAALLDCPRSGAARLAGATDPGPTTALALGALFEQVAHLVVERVVDPEADGPLRTLDRACEALRTVGADDLVDVVLGAERDLLAEQLAERVRRFRASWRTTLHPAWWYRSELPLELALGDLGDGPAAVVACRIDIALGPTPPATGSAWRPRLLVELKSGRPDPGHVDDLALYLLVAALVEGAAPNGGAVWWAAPALPAPQGLLCELRADAPRLQSAAVRVGRALEVLADVMQGRVATNPGPWCRFCPDRRVCPVAADPDEDDVL